jgi:hypothetical protein
LSIAVHTRTCCSDYQIAAGPWFPPGSPSKAFVVEQLAAAGTLLGSQWPLDKHSWAVTMLDSKIETVLQYTLLGDTTSTQC